MAGKKKNKKETLSDAALEIVALRFKCLSDPTRLKLIQALFDGERTVQDLCNATKLSQANVSKHLSMLNDQGVLRRRKQGLFVYYSIADKTIYQLCDLVCTSLAERFARAKQEVTGSANKKGK